MIKCMFVAFPFFPAILATVFVAGKNVGPGEPDIMMGFLDLNQS